MFHVKHIKDMNSFEKFLTYFNIITTGVLVQIFGGFDVLLHILIYLTVIDFITGILKARSNSEKCYKGIIKKVMIFIIVSVAVQIDKLFNNTLPLREVVITFYIANEGISLLENASEFIPIPDKIKKYFTQLQKKGKEDDEEDEE